jgi:hypothetical protein
MSPQEKHFTNYARELADNQAGQARYLQRQMRETDDTNDEPNKQIRAAQAASARFETYVAILRAQLQCPDCWITRSHRSDLRSIDAPDDASDWFACNTCQRRYEIPRAGIIV